MFDEIFFPRTAEKHRAAPLAEPEGSVSSPSQGNRHLSEHLRKCANDHLNLVRLLNPQEDDRISVHAIEAAATIWSRPKGRRCDRAATAKACGKGSSATASICCAFWAGSMKTRNQPPASRRDNGPMRIGCANERGLSDSDDQMTIAVLLTASSSGLREETRRWTTSRCPISTMPLRQSIGGELGTEGRLHDYAQRLRPFLPSPKSVAGVGRGWPWGSWRLDSWRTRPYRRASSAKTLCVCWPRLRAITRSRSATARS